MASVACPPWAVCFGFAGVAASMIFSSACLSRSLLRRSLSLMLSAVGAAYGTSKAGVGIAGAGTIRPEIIMKSLIPVVMAGIIAVYGLVVSVLIVGGLSPDEPYSLYHGWIFLCIVLLVDSLFRGFIHLAAGLSCGLTGLSAGHAIGIVGDACVRAYVQQSRIFVAMVLMLIFAEVIGLYGLLLDDLFKDKTDMQQD